METVEVVDRGDASSAPEIEELAGLIALGILLFFIVAELAQQYSYWALVASPLGFLRISMDENFKTPPFAAVFICQFLFAAALWIWASAATYSGR